MKSHPLIVSVNSIVALTAVSAIVIWLTTYGGVLSTAQPLTDAWQYQEHFREGCYVSLTSGRFELGFLALARLSCSLHISPEVAVGLVKLGILASLILIPAYFIRNLRIYILVLIVALVSPFTWSAVEVAIRQGLATMFVLIFFARRCLSIHYGFADALYVFAAALMHWSSPFVVLSLVALPRLIRTIPASCAAILTLAAAGHAIQLSEGPDLVYLSRGLALIEARASLEELLDIRPRWDFVLFSITPLAIVPLMRLLFPRAGYFPLQARVMSCYVASMAPALLLHAQPFADRWFLYTWVAMPTALGLLLSRAVPVRYTEGRPS